MSLLRKGEAVAKNWTYAPMGAGGYQVLKSEEIVGVVERHPAAQSRWTYRLEWEGSAVIELTQDGQRMYATRDEAASQLMKAHRAYQRPAKPLKKTTRRRKR